ncbi:hypothetical protein [Candidatus Pantoea formicae]|uniref:hypothetical protein n=1 Tax=Candidatus Pantoea formicae TaxID=2608355 RepID=UPI003ED96E75
MKVFVVSMATVAIFYSSLSFSSAGFSGEWSGFSGHQGSSSYSTLNLKIMNDGKEINGRYCYITRGGERIDCPDDDKYNLHGTVYGNKAVVKFNSTFGGRDGLADLTLTNNGINWHLVKKPDNGDFYAPDDMNLSKVNVRRNASIKSRVFSTKGFTITLVNNCGDFYASCGKANYYGMKKDNGNQISLSGKTIDSKTTVKAKGMAFENGDVNYIVTFDPLKLKVMQGNKVLLEQSGEWE